MELTQQAVYKLIKQFSGQANVLTIPRLFVDLTGDHISALFLSQVIYWSERTNDPEGWFYKTDKEWIDELGITRHQLNRITRKAPDGKRPVSPLVEKLGLEVKVGKVGTTPVTHYRLDSEMFTKAIIHYLENPQSGLSTNQTAENPQSGLSMESPKSGFSLHTEITKDYLTKTTAVACAEQPKATPDQEPKTHAQPDLPDTRANHLPRRPNRGEGDRIAEYYAAKIGQDKDSLSRRDYELIGQLVTDGFILEHCQPHIDRICTEVWARGAEIRSFGIFVKAIRQLDPRKQAPLKAPIRGVDIPKLYKVSNDPADFPDDRGFLRIIQSRKLEPSEYLKTGTGARR